MKVLVIVKATKASKAGQMPSQQLLNDIGKFNEELVKAGVMLAAEGLQPSSKGARVRFSGKSRIVLNAPPRPSPMGSVRSAYTLSADGAPNSRRTEQCRRSPHRSR